MFTSISLRVSTLLLVALLPDSGFAQAPIQTGLRVWFKADAGVTAPSGTVTAWTDQTANGIVLMPPATGPVLTPGSVNGLPALTFDGTRQLNGNLGGVSPGDSSIFALFRYTVADSDNDYLYALGAGGGSGSQLTLARQNSQRAYHFDGSTQNLSANNVMPAAQWFVSSQIYGGSGPATHALFLNGASILRTTASNPYAPAPSPFVIGNYSSGSFRFIGDLVELLIYDHPLIEADRRSVENYLRLRAGLPAFFEQEAEIISSWDVIQYELNAQPDAQWIFDLGGTRADQAINSDPSILLRPGDASGKVIWGKIGSGNAPDFMGFVFGYRERGKFYLFDWRKETASYQSFGSAPAGMRLRKFHVDAADPEGRDFWAADNAAHVTVLRQNALPWVDGVDYDFSLRDTATGFIIRVWQGGTVLQEWRVENAADISGRFGYFVNSLQNVRFGQVFTHDLQQVNIRSFTWQSAPGSPLNLRWIGGEPPYILERRPDLVGGMWQPLSDLLWSRDSLAPYVPPRDFFRIRSVGEALTNP